MSGNQDYKSATSVYDFTVKSMFGEDVPLSKYKGHVLIIVNVASKHGLTAANFKELNDLHFSYSQSQGLRILAFPCKQFGAREPGSTKDICSFEDCKKMRFKLFDAVDVNGENTHPLWKYMKEEQGGLVNNYVQWNFTKFIINREGKVVGRHSPKILPCELLSHLKKHF